MKISSVILACSACANVVLVGAIVHGVSREESAARARRLQPSVAKVVTPSPAAGADRGWSEVNAQNVKDQADKLRAEGFPPSMIRAIIAAQIRAGFADRRKAIEVAQGEQPFWRPTTPDPNAAAALRALAMEEQKAIKDVLGNDPVNSPAAALRRQFPNFSEETIDQIAAIRERYDEQRMGLYNAMRGPGSLLPDEQAKIDALDKAMHGEIAAVLTPRELEDYDLRTTNTANQLRYELVAFDATEQEFRALYKLKSAFDEQWGSYRGGGSEEQMRARSEAQKQLNDQIKVALGPERFAEYQRATDYNYRQTTQLIARLNLPPETANHLYTIQKEFEQRRSDLYRGGSGPPGSPAFERIVQQTTALQSEALARVTPVLGSAQFVDAYKQYGGSWLTNMVPRPPVNRPPPPKS